MNPETEDLGGVASKVRKIVAAADCLRELARIFAGWFREWKIRSRSFAMGLSLSLVLLYLILVAQFRSFLDPVLILLAVPTGIIGVLLILRLTGTTLNVMSLMGLIMMVGIVVSNSILIVEFAHRLEETDAGARSGDLLLSHPAAPHSDDIAGDNHRPVSAGAEIWHWKRAVCAARARDHRRLARFCGADNLHCAGCLSAGLSASHRAACHSGSGGRAMRMPNRLILLSVVAALSCPVVAAQGVQKLDLKEAEALAIKNHPQIQAATELAHAAKAQVTEARSAYYPTVNGSITGADAENNSRITAGLNNPIIYERYANGLAVSQLITNFGRTHELSKSANLHAQAQRKNVVTSRADVLLGVDQAYFAALRSQAVLTVAQETVKERQLVPDQVTVLSKTKSSLGWMSALQTSPWPRRSFF